MDREPEEVQFLGLYGIYIEASKIIWSWKKILTQINLALILPLSFILLAQLQISDYLFQDIIHTEHELQRAQPHSRMYDSMTSEWITYWLFKGAYFLFFLVLSLLSTSAIVYTVACIYTSKELSFNKVMGVVPKVWKRLLLTFLCNFVVLFCYNLVAGFIFFTLCFFVIDLDIDKAALPILIILIILYLIGFVYINVVWHLASVVSVLEDMYGFRAMLKSKDLIKGKMWVASAIFLKLHTSFVAIQIAFHKLVVHGFSHGLLNRVCYGILCLVLLTMLIHFWFVIQTVIYFVCKSYHHENIDKSCLADHLEVYRGDYVPLKGKDVQLQSFYV